MENATPLKNTVLMCLFWESRNGQEQASTASFIALGVGCRVVRREWREGQEYGSYYMVIRCRVSGLESECLGGKFKNMAYRKYGST